MARSVSQTEIDAVAREIAPLLEDGQVVELRIPKVGDRYKKTHSGYFDNVDDLARWAASYSGKAPGVYITLNPVKPALFARAANRVKEAESTTSDSDIVCRRWLPFDGDVAGKPADISSTDAEHEAVLSRMASTAQWLSSRGWPEPIYADSGNGAHLLYRLPDLPNDAKTDALLKRVLQATAMTMMNDDQVALDTSVSNAARIWKCYGTMVCKGDDVPGRPHRLAHTVSLPQAITPVTLEMLQQVADLLPVDDVDSRPTRRRMGDFDLAAWLVEHRLPVSGPRAWQGNGKKWVFDVCPWNSAHTDRSAFVVQLGNGAIAAGCHHNGCQGHDWHDLREMYDGPSFERSEQRHVEYTAQRQINREGFDALRYRPEDGGVLDAWLDLYAFEWLFASGRDVWLRWRDTHWKPDETLQLQAQVESLLNDMNLAAKGAADDAAKEMKKMGKDDPGRGVLEAELTHYRALVAATRRSSARISSVVGLAAPRRTVHARELDALNGLNLANGTLDLDTFELRPHRREDMLTYVLPYAYDEQAKCPRWKQFLNEVLVKANEDGSFTPDEDLIRLYQELWGYSLTTDTKYEVIVFQSGEGGNGKGTATFVLNHLLGSQLAATLDFAKLGTLGNYDTSVIPGKRVLLSTESRKRDRAPEDILKTIASGEPIRSRAPYERPFQFDPVAKIWWSMNHLPRISDTTVSIWRRMKVIPFRRKFTITDGTADPTLKPRLLEELPGILNWALLGLERLNSNGQFTQAAAVDEQVATYRDSSNPVKLWVEACCRPVQRPTSKPADLYDHYLRWCDNNGYSRDEIINSWEFGHELGRLGYPSRKINVGMRYPLVLQEPLSRRM